MKEAIRGSLALGVVLMNLVVVLMLVLTYVMMGTGRRERSRCHESHNGRHEKNPHELAHTNSPCVERQTFGLLGRLSFAVPTTQRGEREDKHSDRRKVSQILEPVLPQQLPQHERQNATVAVVFDLDGRVDARNDRHFLLRTVGAMDH